MIRCIAVDDEPLALEIIEDYAKKSAALQLVQKFNRAADALKFLQEEERVDLIFLDIKMPDIDGIQLVKSLKNPPLIIFTSAYEQYALDGYNLDVIDYLLKPISFERFLKSVTKVQEYLSKEKTPSSATTGDGKLNDYIFIKTEYKIIKINLEDILFIEALKDYTKIYTQNQPVLTLRSLKSFENKLPQEKFIRVHRSYLVSLDKINSVERNTVMIANQPIPISEGYRDRFYELISRNS